MSLKKCIDNALSHGEITLDEADQLKKRYDTLARRILAKGEARQQLIDEIEKEAAERKRRALLTETTRVKRVKDILEHVNAQGYHDPAEALVWLLEHQGQARFGDVKARQTALQGMAHAKMERMLHEFSGKAKITGDMSRRFGQTAARLDNMVRELFGETTGDQNAAEFATVWQEVTEDLRQQFNAAGGAIGKLENWGLPQHHDQEALIRAGMQKWIDGITPLLDVDKMRNPLTGHKLTPEDLQETLKYIWENITTEGWSTRDPSASPRGRGALFSQHADHRFLHFKDADAWLKYQKDFGSADPFSNMMGHISTMTRDIALMEVLGPNPAAMMNYLKEVVLSQAARTRPNNIIRQEQLSKIRRLMADLPESLEEMQYKMAKTTTELDEMRRKQRAAYSAGKVDHDLSHKIAAKKEELRKQSNEVLKRLRNAEWPNPDKTPLGATLAAKQERIDEINALLNELREELPDHFTDPMARARKWSKTADNMFHAMRGGMNAPESALIANVMQGTRNLVTASSLGSAVVSAISDVSFQAATRAMVGMPQTRIISEYVKRLAPGGQQTAVRAGLILDSALHVMDRQARYAATVNFAGKTGYIADRVLALSGLSPFTQAGKHAFGMDLQAHVADTIGSQFKDLTPEWRGFLERNGIGPDEWARLQTVPIEDDGGARFLRPQEIEVIDRELALTYMAMIHRFTKMAVPEPTVRARAGVIGDSAPGTAYGELARLVTQFKGFSIGVMFLHGMAIYRDILGKNYGTAALRATGLLIPMTILGGLAIQIKELINGKDPRKMDAPFLGAAFMQGGGLGIYGDFLFADVNRFGGGLTSTFAGPVVGRLDNLRNLTIGNIQDLASDKDTNFGREAVRALRQNTPGGNIWYLRLAYERLLLDKLQEMADPQAHRAFRRAQQRRMRDYGQQYWWAPGQDEPSRAPDLTAAIP